MHQGEPRVGNSYEEAQDETLRFPNTYCSVLRAQFCFIILLNMSKYCICLFGRGPY